MISGGRLDNFRRGWALYVWGGAKVHRWRRISIEAVVSLCGIERPALWTTPSGERHSTMYDGGDFDACHTCLRKRVGSF